MRLLEHYVSTQGEGPKVGTPTQFVRFAGCNLRCPGWPCDTEFAIEPDLWRGNALSQDVPAMLRSIENYRDRYGAKNICLTGGEPLLQDRDQLYKLAYATNQQLGCAVEMFTNGSRSIPIRLTTWCTFVMDWKLPGSGERFTDEYEKNRRENVAIMASGARGTQTNSIKFVCKDLLDLTEACRVYEELDLGNWNGDIFFGVVWKKLKPSVLVDYLLAKPLPKWRLNIQAHNYIWKPNERRR